MRGYYLRQRIDIRGGANNDGGLRRMDAGSILVRDPTFV